MQDRTVWKVPLAAMLVLLVCSGAALGGMAELGQRRNLNIGPEDGSDTAAGGGQVIIIANGQTATHDTIAGETVSDILADLATQLDGFPGLAASHMAGSDEITVTAGRDDVNSLQIQSTDTAFGFVSVSRTERATVSVDAISQPPAGNGTVQIIIDDETARAVTVSTASFAGDAAGLNAEILTELGNQGFQAIIQAGRFRITRDLTLGRAPRKVSFEENDTSVVETISILGVISEDPTPIPTLSTWGVVLQMLLLGGALVYLSRRRQRA